MKGVSLEELMEMWSKDSKLDLSDISIQSLKTPDLHGKYLNIRTYHRVVAKKIQTEYDILKKLKLEYYNGNLNTDKETLEKHKWEPLRSLILKQDIHIHIDSDSELVALLLKRAVHDEIVEYCNSVLGELSRRNWTIRNTIEWEKFISGK